MSDSADLDSNISNNVVLHHTIHKRSIYLDIIIYIRKAVCFGRSLYSLGRGASEGACMQEGSLSLMQMEKLSSALYNYQSNKKLLYVSILTFPTTGGVTASFGILGDIIIAEPDAYIAFAGKRVIEQTLNKIVPEGSQSVEYLFDTGLFDPIVPHNPLKGVLSELFQLHDFFPLNQNSLFFSSDLYS